MRRVKLLAARPSSESPPQIVWPTDADVSGEKFRELGGVASHCLGVEYSQAPRQFFLDQCEPFLAGQFTMILDPKRLAHSDERLRRAFIPEGVFQCDGQHRAASHPRCEMADAGLQCERPLTNVAEPPLRRDPEDAVRLGENCLPSSQKRGGPSDGLSVHSDEAKPLEECVSRHGLASRSPRSGRGSTCGKRGRCRSAGPTTRGDSER